MRKALSFAQSMLPLAMLAMALVMVAQFAMHDGVSIWAGLCKVTTNVCAFVKSHIWWFIGLATFPLLFVVAGYLHELKPLEKRSSTDKRKWLMDILDRLTNRPELEQRLQAEVKSVFIDAAELTRSLKAKVIGQDAVCDDVSAQIRRRLALNQRGKPVGVFLFAGPPGTGKSYLAKRLAISLEKKLLHFDMTQFARGGASATQLFGSSKGYAGSDTYGKLTASLRDVPDSVVLLDEFEKAHPEVHKNFLTAWNDGFITEASDGQQINTTKAIFVLTSNAATDALQQLSAQFAGDEDELRRTATNALREVGFAPEVLNRIDRIFVFKPLTGLDIARVTALEIESMVHSYGLEVADGGIDAELLFDMLKRQTRMGSNASSRDLVRAAEEAIADSLIDAKQNGHLKVVLEFDQGKVVVRPVPSSNE